MELFKKYDIRGIYPDSFNEEIAYKIGRAFAQFLGVREIVVGHDMRDSSPKLLASFVKGIRKQGVDVTNIGMCSTPMLYFAAKDKPGSAMLTASHNPAQYNGLKLCRESAIPINGDNGLFEIKRMYEEEEFENSDKEGDYAERDIKEEFTSHNLKLAENISDLKIVFDFGNGMGGLEFPLVFDKIDCEKTYLYQNPDGNFPNHEANPLKHETLKDLCETVLDKKADIGIATDGDSDRVGFVDEKGNIINCDIVLALIAEELLKKSPGEKILYDVKCSKTVKETIIRNGGTPLVWKTGHALIKEKMRDENVLFGGEKSGHYFFRDNFFVESSLMACFVVLKLMSKTQKKLSELLAPYLTYVNSGEVNFEAVDKDEALKRIEKYYDDASISHLDGVTVEYDDWWFNLRKSNTEPLLRLNLEASTAEKVKEEVSRIKGIINNER